MRGICTFDNSDPEPLVAKFSLRIFLTSISISNKEDVSFVLQLYDPRNQQNLTRQQVQFNNSSARLQEDAEPN